MQRFRRNYTLIIAAGLLFCLAGWYVWSSLQKDTDGLAYRPVHVDAGAMLHLAQVLSSDALEGRAAGSKGNEAARGFIHKRFEEIGLLPLPGYQTYSHPFTVLPRTPDSAAFEAVNLIGFIPGSQRQARRSILIVTAHYDHLGIRDGEIYNGADDNASGAAALTAVADYFSRHAPESDMIIAALDAEEIGLLGARALLRMEGIDTGRIGLNVNLDMVSRSPAGELYVAGTYHTPLLEDVLAPVMDSAPVLLRKGHDRPELGAGDWTLQSDHGPFHEAGIPFLYFGVEDHPGYHDPSDDFDQITPEFYVRAGDTIIMAIKAADRRLDEIHASRQTNPATAP